MALLSLDNLDVAYGNVQALRGVSLTVGDREMVALLGANGAGKTTTLRTISGLIAPRTGTITFDGEPIAGRPAHELVARGLAHLPEGRDLFAPLTVEENLRYGYWTKRRDKSGYATQLDRVMDHFPRLRERRRQAAGTLSGGEQQMLGVARALMSSPRLLLVDELSLGLAPMIVEQLFEILKQVNGEGTAILLVEQFVHMSLSNTDRAYVLAKGEVALEGRSDELLADPQLIASYLGEQELEAANATGASAAPAPAPRRRSRSRS
ncbi:MAG: branched-chain amino acid transport system ATP-binding protein [Actinomycetota bacterium]|nr:branched-chain amino acid transport system ATP-binding protein [Actinomycetota bacterium]